MILDRTRRLRHSIKAHPLQGAGFLLALLPLLSAARADDPPPGHAVARRLDGTTFTGPLQAFTDDRVRLGPSGDRRRAIDVPTADLLSLALPGGSAEVADLPTLEFANGDRIAVEVGKAEEDAVAVRLGDVPLRIPLETLRGVAFRPFDSDEEAAGLFFRESGADDLVVLTNGDRLSGQLLALSDSHLTLDAGGREVRIPRERLAAVAFSPELISPATIDGPRQVVQSAAGWLTVRDLARSDDDKWNAVSAFGEPVSWPADAVRRISFAGGRVEFLSDLDPSNIEFVPYLDRVWPIRKNRAVTGEPLTAGGTVFATGLGVHSRCRLTYDLAGDYAAFHAVAGLADSARDIGSVEFAVEVDGRELIRTGPMTNADPPVRIDNLDLSGAQTLTLTADFGRNADTRDHANWCNALFVRKP